MECLTLVKMILLKDAAVTMIQKLSLNTIISTKKHLIRDTFRTLTMLLAVVCFSGIFEKQLYAQKASEEEGRQISEVWIEGLVRTDPKTLTSKLKTRPGQTYNADDVKQDLNFLGRRLKTATVQVKPSQKGGLNVVFVVEEFPTLREIQVIGNERLSAARIESLAGLKEGDVIDESALRSIKRAIGDEYRVAGLPDATVSANLAEFTPAVIDDRKVARQVDLQIIINEGRSVLVKGIVFNGNKAFSARKLRGVMETKGSLGPFKNYYRDETFEDDLQRLREFYAARGYFDARVERGAFEEVLEGKRLEVSPVVQITEGSPYTFGSASVHGARLITQQEAVAPFKPLEGKLFDGEKFVKALGKLSDQYAQLGLITTRISPQYEYDEQNHIVNLAIDVDEKEVIHVGRIQLKTPSYEDIDTSANRFVLWYGKHVSPPLKESVILRQVLLKPGEVYNKRQERDTERRLARLGVFEEGSIKVYNEPSGTTGVHDVVIEAQPASTGSISGGVGYGDVSGIFAFVGYTERNFGGEGDVVSLNGILGQKDSSVTFSYFNRQLGDTENSLLTRLYYLNQHRPGYKAQVVGSTVDLGRDLNENWRVLIGPRVEYVKLKHAHGIDAEENLDRSYTVATMRLRFENDTRYPYGYRPHEGHLQTFSVEAGYADNSLAKFEYARDQYIPITERVSFRIDGFAGLSPYNASKTPIHERYFLGGANDLRGFKYRGAGYVDPKDHDVPTGGAAKLLARTELHFPIAEPVWGVGFFDAGVLARSPSDWDSPRASAGAGLRFDLGRVQAAVDFAAPVIKKKHDKTRFFHFSMKSSF